MDVASILLVEGNAVTRKMMRATLNAERYHVRETGRASEALRLFEEEQPDLVLSDLMLPDMDGFELFDRLQRLDPSAAIPVLAVSALADDGRAREVGFREYLMKPIEPARLVRAVQVHLSSSRRSIQPGSRRSEPISVAPTDTERRRPTTSIPVEPPPSDRLWKAMPALLSVIAEVAERPRGIERALDEILSVFLDASGFTAGAAFLESATGSLALRAQAGCADGTLPQLGELHGHLEFLADTLRKGDPCMFDSASPSAEARAVMEADGTGSMLVIPLVFRHHRLGLLVLKSPNQHLRSGWLDVANAASGPVAQALVLARTVSEVSKSEQRFRAICEAATDGILVADTAGSILYMNTVATSLFGDLVKLSGRAASTLFPFFDPEAGGTQHGELLVSGRGTVGVEVSYRDLHDPNLDARRVYVVRDLSDKLKIAELMELATRDSLTGLFNRRRFEEELKARLAESSRYGTKGVLVLVDLDRFKDVNDTYGHLAGDLMLRAVADVLTRVTRESDVPARLGGDEFAVLLPHADPSHALLCAEKIRRRLAETRVEVDGISISIEASIGVAAFPQHGLSQMALFAAADAALYQAKREGRNRACVAPSEPAAAMEAVH